MYESQPIDPSTIISENDRSLNLGHNNENVAQPEIEKDPEGLSWLKSIPLVTEGEANRSPLDVEWDKVYEDNQDTLLKEAERIAPERSVHLCEEIVGDLSHNTFDLMYGLIKDNPDMIYIAPTGAFMPAFAASACCEELEKNYNFSKWNQGFRKPFFFFPHNKSFAKYNMPYTEKNYIYGGQFNYIGIWQILEKYPNRESVPEDLNQIRADLSLTTGSHKYKELNEQTLAAFRTQIMDMFDLIDESTETIKSYSETHPGQITISCYDEAINEGVTRRSLNSIIDEATQELPDLRITRSDIRVNSSDTPIYHRPMKLDEERHRISINHRGDDLEAFEKDQKWIDFAKFVGKKMAKFIALQFWIKDKNTKIKVE